MAWNFANLATITGRLACLTGRPGRGLGQGRGRLIASSFIFAAAGPEIRSRLCAEWPFAVFGRGVLRLEHARHRVSSDHEADGIEYRIPLLNRSEYRSTTPGMRRACGTGSNYVRVADTFVAEKMTVAVSDLLAGQHPEVTLFLTHFMRCRCLLFPYVLSGVGLGTAQACLNDYVEFARHRASTYNRAKLATCRPLMKIAEASAKITRPASSCAPTVSTRWRMRRRGQIPIYRSRPGCGGTALFR